MDEGQAEAEQKRPVAVAIKAGSDTDRSPQAGASPEGARIVASGRGKIAEQILRIAFDRGIRVREDQELAEILSALDVESPIPLPALAAVAEILAYLYRSRTLPAAGAGA